MDPETNQTVDGLAASRQKATNSKRQSPSIAYSCVLLLSTSVAAFFCYLYLSKPVIQIVNTPGPSTSVESKKDAVGLDNPMPEAPAKTRSIAKSQAPIHENLEETNLRIQHVLTAESTDGRVDRIELTVPVLYQSRGMLWSEAEVATARDLHTRLTKHREQTRMLREDGKQLLAAWNDLILRSIPAQALRADSPSLPANQKDSIEQPRPAGWTSNELIEIKASDP